MSEPVMLIMRGTWEKTGAEAVGEFTCRKALPMWRLMKLAKDMRDPDPFAKMAGMYETVMSLVVADERAALDEFMCDIEMEAEALTTAIGDALQLLAGRPKDSSTPSASSSPPTKTSTSSQGDSLPPVIRRDLVEDDWGPVSPIREYRD